MRLIAILFLLFVSRTVSTQVAVDTAYINFQNRYAYDIHEIDSDTALQICRRLLELSRKIHFLKGQGDANLTIGAIYRNDDNFIESDRHFKESLSLRRMVGDSNRVAAVLINLGINRCLQTQYDKAIARLLEAVKILETIPEPDIILQGGAYLELSNVFDEYLVPDDALRYAQKSLQTYIKANKSEFIGEAAYTLGNRFHEDNVLDSSLYYYNLAYNNFLSSSSNPDYIANILTNKAIIFTEKGDYDIAGDYYRQAEATLQKMGEDADYFHLFLNKAEWYIRQGQMQQGLAFLIKAKSSGVETLNDLEKKILYEDLATIYAKLYMFDSAYYYQSEANIVRDSIYNETKRKQFIRLQAERYKTEFMQQAAIVQRQISRARLLKLAATLFALIAVILVIVYYQRRKTFRIISNQKEALHRQAVDELIQSSELKFLNASMEGGEIAKEHISREIHDRLGSAMVTLSWQYDAVLENFPAGSPYYYQMEKLNTALKNLYHDIRQIAHQLGSGVLERVGLLPVLQELCDDIAAANKIEVDFSFFGLDDRLNFIQEINILRIIQELVSNTLKYANATQLSIQMNKMGTELNIMVEDNGKGFDLNSSRVHGVGIANVESRIRNLNGTMQIESQPGTGTSVILNIPILLSETTTLNNDQTY